MSNDMTMPQKKIVYLLTGSIKGRTGSHILVRATMVVWVLAAVLATLWAATYTYYATYKLNGGTAVQSNQTYSASATDTSGVWVTNSGNLTMNHCTITTSGNTSSQDNSSFYGLNAGVLAAAGTITMSGGTITTTGTGANGAFAVGSASRVDLSDVTINASANGGHGVMATQGGVMTLTNVVMNTAGKNSGVVATDRGSGTITMTGGSATASGQDSPGIYSTGTISVSDATISATGAEAAVIEGANSIHLTNTALSSTKEGKWGVMIYQSMSGDAEGTEGTFTMIGGSLSYTSVTGPLFYVTNSTGNIDLSGVKVTVGSGLLVKASTGNWGTSGKNGGNANFTVGGQNLTGNMTADSYSTITAVLKNSSSLNGTINGANTGKSVSLSMDATSSWTLTGTSYLTTLLDSSGVSGTSVTNITGNGYNVYYDSSAAGNSYLGGLTYSLVNGGQLLPKGSTGTCTYAASPSATSFLSSGGSGTVTVTTDTGCSWTATSSAAWLTITTGSSGSGSGTVSFTVAANPAASTRSTTLTVGGQTIGITQAAAAAVCSYTATASATSFPSPGGNGTVAVTTGTGCSWTAISGATWLTITSGSSGSGGGTVLFTVSANTTTSSRTANIVIAGQIIPITQSAASSACTVSLSASSATFHSPGGTGTLFITTGSGCTWTATSSSSWIVITGGSGGTGSGTITYQVSANATSATRTGNLTIGNATFQVTQEGSVQPQAELVGSMAQVAAGGGWQTQFTLIPTGTETVSYKLDFSDNAGIALALPLISPQLGEMGIMSTLEGTLEPGATLIVETAVKDGPVATVGSARLYASGSMDGFAIFQETRSGQEAVVPLERRNASFLLAFDNTEGLRTGLAIANLNAEPVNVSMMFKDDTGKQLSSPVTITLPAYGHTSFMLTESISGYPPVAGLRGSVELDPGDGGRISVVGLRFNSAGAVTTLPAIAK